MLAWPILCALVLEMFPEDFHREFFMLFEAFLRRVLVHPQCYTSPCISGNLPQTLVYCLSPYQQTQGILVLFEAFLPHILVHHRRLSLYQQTLMILVIFEAVLLHILVHHLCHLSLYQQTLGRFWCFLKLFYYTFLFIIRVI